ncbi:GGDEF domain-containing protein [Fusibacter paucivorans]|uniref:GGDEF domain-containing protein n=1 Tax=Fusibacter paucivorans TaxID=76009 RepID=A0ABS5PLE0_9FIRM|nr:sensor domain-containing diguanylate cyclase [Fusibacter paucivorans]MBS7525983.1 GGDEF domain-containing protein [Fusibacter paucivorans]
MSNERNGQKRAVRHSEPYHYRKEAIRPKDIAFYVALMSVILVTLICLIVYVDEKSNTALKASIVDKEMHILSAEAKLFSTSFDEAVSDLLYLKTLISADTDLPINERALSEERMAVRFIEFLSTHLHYDQVRFIGVDGMERVRVINTPTGAEIVSETGLQDKRSREYFVKARELIDGAIHISALDLNVENDEVEKPYNPVVRFSTPIFKGDSPEGILVINYKLDDLLMLYEQFSEGTDSELLLLDSDGYYLVSPDPSQTWGNSILERSEITFGRLDPLAWVAMLENDTGKVQTEAGGYIYQALTQETVASEATVLHTVPLIAYDPGRLMMVSFISKTSDVGYLFSNDQMAMFLRVVERYKWFLMMAFIVMLGFFPFLLSRRFTRAKIKRFSEIDSLTGVYNRRKGFDLLEEILSDYDEQLSICFIDVNGLKVVNDTLGHEAGDKLLQTSAELLKEKIRNEDVLCRFGGDEFVIGFVGTTPQEAEVIWKRILEGVQRFNQTAEAAFVISLSHGVSGISELSQANLEALIHLADERMYREKAIIKRNLQVIHRDATDYII